VQAFTANEYSLENTQIISNSDGGAGYSCERFKEAFSQASRPLVHQLDSYHIGQALNRTFGWKKSTEKTKVKKSIEDYNLAEFKLLVDTYESTFEDEKKIEKVREFRKYILGHWEFVQDWRERIDDAPKDARGLGAMESNQRHISFRMKKRGMHWSEDGAEAMVKIKQGLLNGTLREAYLISQKTAEKRSDRKQRKFKKTVHMTKLLHQKTRPSIGAKQGSIGVYTAHSSAIGRLAKSFS